jgi:hypothetical protein
MSVLRNIVGCISASFHTLKLKLVFIIFKHSVLTSKKTQSTTIAKINQLMPFREIIAIYSENHVKPTNTLRGPNAELLIVKARGTRVKVGLY